VCVCDGVWVGGCVCVCGVSACVCVCVCGMCACVCGMCVCVMVCGVSACVCVCVCACVVCVYVCGMCVMVCGCVCGVRALCLKRPRRQLVMHVNSDVSITWPPSVIEHGGSSAFAAGGFDRLNRNQSTFSLMS